MNYIYGMMMISPLLKYFDWYYFCLFLRIHKYFLYILIISFNNTIWCCKEFLFFFKSGNLLVNSLTLLYYYKSLLDIF